MRGAHVELLEHDVIRDYRLWLCAVIDVSMPLISAVTTSGLSDASSGSELDAIIGCFGADEYGGYLGSLPVSREWFVESVY